ncbi:glycosyltransferase, partial [Pseudomonas sp. 2822-17]|uniref:glycosyltransferase n=1 Tax=Pseudomonas sp. 2822-17 TaxID=1712678 RepID=UPI0034D1B49A
MIVVDDGSTDETISIATNYTNYVIRHEVNKGKGSAVMTGLSAVNGEWVMLLDADLGESVTEAKKLIAPV